MNSSRITSCLLCLALSGAALAAEPAAKAPPPPGVFDLPRLQGQMARGTLQVIQLFRARRYAEAEKICREMLDIVPHHVTSHYNLACALARQGKTDEAIERLRRAVDAGFRNPEHALADPDLESLRNEDLFKSIIEYSRSLPPPVDPWKRDVAPAAVQDGVAMVTAANTAWGSSNAMFRILFDFPADAKPSEVCSAQGPVGDLLRTWYTEGTCAGNWGDLYDNHDQDHSNMRHQDFPQLTRVEFDREAREAGIHSGLQVAALYNAPTLGNSSTAVTSGPFWRSLPRAGLANQLHVARLFMQYRHNHLYMYPEHRDHDPGDKSANGHGDVYPANTPYLLISQGSSGSDKVFLEAMACTMAAFHPEVKALLVRKGLLMPTLQMLLRRHLKPVQWPEDYLTGKAHPTVFKGGDLNVKAMVIAAHKMTTNALPPVVQVGVVEETTSERGTHYFDPSFNERLFDTPAAIARIHRTVQRDRRMVVSAGNSGDMHGRELKWHWVVLRGDPDRIRITPLNEPGSTAELVVQHHTRRPIAPGSNMESSRVDIGVIVHNGVYYSAPAFVSTYFLANETRAYDEEGRILSVDYTGKPTKERYVDPQLTFTKDWRDDYHYAEGGRMTGWTRTRGKEEQEFTPQGTVVLARDEQGRPTEARAIRYEVKVPKGKAPLVEQTPSETILSYDYASPDDFVGEIKLKEGPPPETSE